MMSDPTQVGGLRKDITYNIWHSSILVGTLLGAHSHSECTHYLHSVCLT